MVSKVLMSIEASGKSEVCIMVTSSNRITKIMHTDLVKIKLRSFGRD